MSPPRTRLERPEETVPVSYQQTVVALPVSHQEAGEEEEGRREDGRRRLAPSSLACPALLLLPWTGLSLLTAVRRVFPEQSSSLLGALGGTATRWGHDHDIGHCSNRTGSTENDPPPRSENLQMIRTVLEGLDDQLDGDVWFRGEEEDDDDAFAEAARAWVRGVVGPPAAVIRALSEADVQRAVPVLANLSLRVPFRIRSGGHHKAGYSTAEDGIVLSVSLMNRIGVHSVEGDTAVATMGPGVTVNQFLDQVLEPTGYAGVIGFCNGVAESGFVLGGGFGMQSRLHGLGLDSVRGMRIVLADGSARAVSASEHADLFFALRGAGGGSFGVVTEIDYTVHAASETFHLLSVTVQEASTMATFLYTLGERQSSLPGNVVAMHDMPLTVNLFWSGRDEADVAGGDAYLRQLVGELLPPDAPVETEAGTYSWPGAFGQRPASSDDDDDDVPWSHDVWAAACWCGFLLPENNTAAVWQRMMELISTAVQDCPDLLPDIELWGGAIGDTAANQTAFPHRSAIYNVGVLLTIPVDRPDPDAYYKQQNAKVNTWWPNVSQYLTGSYVNYPQVSLGRDEYAKTYWGDNLPRLRQIKQRYDPDNVFHHPLSVPIE